MRSNCGGGRCKLVAYKVEGAIDLSTVLSIMQIFGEMRKRARILIDEHVLDIQFDGLGLRPAGHKL